MKKEMYKLTLALLFIFHFSLFTTFGQSPEKVSYQAVVRDASDNLVSNTQVGMQISILQTSASGTAVYVETHTPTTNANGLVSIEIGGGIVVSGDFTAIDWANDTYFVKTETDPAGGTAYSITGTSQLLSVPYALHAKTAETVSGGITESDPIYNASEAANITAGDITNLGNLSGINTGDQDLSGFVTTETDPDFNASVAAGITEIDTANWNDKDIYDAGTGISISNHIISATNLIPIHTTLEIGALTPNTGDAVYNSTEQLYQIFDGTNWISFPATCWPQPTTASAGADQTFDDGTTSATLAANAPEAEHGIGTWSIVSGNGGSFNDANNPTTVFSGSLNEIYILKWSISTACETSSDIIRIVFALDGAGNTITDIDGNTYNTVWIGGQLWMAENLKVTHYPNGDVIPLITDQTAWADLADNNTDDAMCYYNNNSGGEANTYGALYTYAAAIGDDWARDNTDNQGVCPDGWHLPSDAEWTTLVNYLGAADAGSKLAGNAALWTDGALDQNVNFGASGFSALPGGLRTNYDGTFNDLGYSGRWWGSVQLDSSLAYYHTIYYYGSIVDHLISNKSDGFSVRCIKD